jgi:predicted transposase YbfD/YdcC
MQRLTGRKDEVFNLDGKTLCAAVGTAALKLSRSDAAARQVQIVSLFSAMRNIVVGQLRTVKSVNEVKAAQELLELCEIKGRVITADAQHATRRTFEIIVEKGGDFVVTVKKNVAALHRAMLQAFETDVPIVIETREKRGKVVEIRRYEIIAATETTFPLVMSFVRVTRVGVSHSGPQDATKQTLYAATIPASDAELTAQIIRKRWHIENGLHHGLDVEFEEDRSTNREGTLPEQFARVRHWCFSLLSTAKMPKKKSIPVKRLLCAADDRILARVLRLPWRK